MTKIAEAVVEISLKGLGAIKAALAGLRTAFQGLGAAIKSALGPLLVIAAAGLGLKAIFGAAVEAESASVKLSNALKLNGQEVENNKARFEAFAASVAKSTTISDDAVKNLISTAINLGVPAAEADKFAASAIGLARVLGVDLETALESLAKEAQGVESPLTRQIPALKGVEDTTARLAIINQIAANGMAEEREQVNTLGGSWEQLKNALGELAEALGGLVSGTLTKLIQGITKSIEWFTAFIETVRETGIQSQESFGWIGTAFSAVVAIISGYVNFLVSLFQVLVYSILHWKDSFAVVAAAAQYGFQLIVAGIQWAWANFVAFANWLVPGFGTGIQNVCTFAWEALKTLGGAIAKIFSWVSDTVSETFNSLVKTIGRITGTVADTTKGLFEGFEPVPIDQFLPDKSELDKTLDTWKKGFDDFNKGIEGKLKPAENIEGGGINALPAAANRDEKQEEGNSSAGTFTGLQEAWKRIQEGVTKNAEKLQLRAAVAGEKAVNELMQLNRNVNNINIGLA